MSTDASIRRAAGLGVVRRAAPRLDLAFVFVIAAAVRGWLILGSTGGVGGNVGYDEGVYFAASDALLHGRMPYADYILLHPPGIAVALLPFTALAQVIGDHPAFMAANLSFTALGAANAVLVTVIARRLAWGRRAALLGGLFYATWFGAVEAEFSARLEPLGTALFLGAVAIKVGGPDSRRRVALAGALLAAAVSVKIWWCVPAVIVSGYWLWRRPRDQWRALLIGAGTATAVLDLPFFVRAPVTMWRMVVTDQLQRAAGARPPRFAWLLGVRRAFPHLDGAGQVLLVALVGLGALALGIRAWPVRSARFLVIIAVAQAVLLVRAPSFLAFYTGFVAGPAALVVAAAAAPRAGGGGRRPRGRLSAVALATAATSTVIALAAHPIKDITPFPTARLHDAGRSARCVQSDSPTALIELDALSRGLADGCVNWVDVTGRTYELRPQATSVKARVGDRHWHRELVRYLRSGDAVIMVRSHGTGIGPRGRQRVECGSLLATAGGYRLYATTGPGCR